MTTAHRAFVAVIGVLVIGLSFVGVAWLKAHDAWRDAQNEAKTQTAIRAHLEQDAKDAQTHFTATGQTTAKTIAEIKTQAAKPMTADEFKAFLSDILPKTKFQTIAGPDNTDLIAIPDTPEVRAEIQQKAADCKIAAVGLAGCTSQLADMTTMRDKALLTADSWKTESGKWESAASAHTGFWKGLKSDALKIGISFGVGYALAKR